MIFIQVERIILIGTVVHLRDSLLERLEGRDCIDIMIERRIPVIIRTFRISKRRFSKNRKECIELKDNKQERDIIMKKDKQEKFSKSHISKKRSINKKLRKWNKRVR